MESKIFFTLGITAKFFLKDGFIILMILLPLGPFLNLAQFLLDKTPSQ